tara:strand:- start:3941 stop:5053 length:1113 start_codon:yes stop_codon:yes gene_type:complete
MKTIECNNCVLDSTVPDITFSDEGECSYCSFANKNIKNFKFSIEDEKNNLETLKKRILDQKNGEYDSIIGLSGGVDSSYVAYLAMELGLNPLCVHFDNGWNSDIAVKNIRNIIEVTKFDLHTYVVDWEEFKDLQRSFFKAGVVDIELLTDHAIYAALFKIRRSYKIKSVLSGTNYATEHGMPNPWTWSKMDLTNIKSIHKEFGTIPIKSFPTMSSNKWRLIKRFGFGGTFEEPLNLINFSKSNAMSKLEDVFDWEYYGGKHFESVFTKFYQAHVLPSKFKIDKRKVHLSDLIRNGEIDRGFALEELSKPLYDKEELIRDKDFVLKKLGFKEEEFDSILSKDPVSHDFYMNDYTNDSLIVKIGKCIFGSKV